MPSDFIEKKYPSLTAVAHQLVLRAPSGLTARTIADVLGKPYQTLMSELSAQQGHKFGADLLLPLMEATASDAPLKFLAQERGGVYLPLPSPATGANELVASLAASIKEFGEFAAEAAADISDGLIPADQLARITKEGQEAVEAILAMMKIARITHAAQCGGN